MFLNYKYNQQKYMKNRKSRLNWTSQEDEIIKSLHEEDHLTSWKRISKELKKRSPTWKRTPKQCRQRYMNSLRFGSQSQEISEWTRVEQEKLFGQVQIYGPRWVKIAQSMPGKSQNCIKNKFYGALRKTIRKINRIDKEEGTKIRKQIKYESLLKFLQIVNVENQREYSQKFGEKLVFFRETQAELFYLTINQEENNSQKYLSMSSKLHQFNSATRYTVCNRKKAKSGSKESYQLSSEQDRKSSAGTKKNTEGSDELNQQQNQQKEPFVFECQQVSQEKKEQNMEGPENIYLMNYVGMNEEWESAEDLLGESIDPFSLLF